MRRPPSRRPRRFALAILTALAACGDDDPAAPHVVEVAAQPCATPNRARGLGVFVADGLVVTAGHTVEGARRDVTVDGAPASVVTVDPRTDVAVLAVDGDAPPALLGHGSAARATLVRPDRQVAVRIIGTGTLTVDDTTDRRRYARQVHTFTPGVEDGTSGAPLVDAEGRVLGIVVLDNPGRGVAYAVTAEELSHLLARVGQLLRSSRSGPSQGEDSCDVRSSGT